MRLDRISFLQASHPQLSCCTFDFIHSYTNRNIKINARHRIGRPAEVVISAPSTVFITSSYIFISIRYISKLINICMMADRLATAVLICSEWNEINIWNNLITSLALRTVYGEDLVMKCPKRKQTISVS